MPHIAYAEPTLNAASLAVVSQANAIIGEYLEMGFKLTLRQLYYQFVARDTFPDDRRWRNVGGDTWRRDPNGTKNATPNYKWLGGLLNKGRMMGLIDWDAIEDRGRNLRKSPTWDSPEAIIAACAEQFQLNPWDRQVQRCEVWIEKEALIGVIEGVCQDLRVPHFACKGYVSQSEAWDSGRNRIRRHARTGKPTTIFHLGDHDPSGLDMTRDLEDRLSLFAEAPVRIIRLALNFDQVEEHQPPPNPAKVTDSRFAGYEAEFGRESWELDALSPSLLAELIRNHVNALVDRELWQAAMDEEQIARETLEAIAERWDDVQEYLAELPPGAHVSFRVRRCPDCKTLRLDTPGPCFRRHQLAESRKPDPPQRPKKRRRWRPPASIATLLGRWDREHGEPPAEPERFRGCGGEPAYQVYMRAYRGESHASQS